MLKYWENQECLPLVDEVVLQDVQAAHHLGEDEHLVSASLEARQQLVQQHQLACRAHKRLQVEVRGHGVVHFPQLRNYLLLRSYKQKITQA